MSTLRDIDNYFLNQEEPVRGCLLALRSYILGYNQLMTETWKYRMPCFCYQGRMFCYLWTDKKTGYPYILMVEGRHIDHPLLQQGDRARMKILPINPHQDIPTETIAEIFGLALPLYNKH